MDKGSFFGCLGMILLLAFGAVQIFAGFAGIQHEFGTGWAIGAMVVTFLTRSSLLIVVGAFLCAWHVWDWHWFWALLFALPTLVFVLPGMVMSVLDWVRR
jgi:hypothetical protein